MVLVVGRVTERSEEGNRGVMSFMCPYCCCFTRVLADLEALRLGLEGDIEVTERCEHFEVLWEVWSLERWSARDLMVSFLPNVRHFEWAGAEAE